MELDFQKLENEGLIASKAYDRAKSRLFEQYYRDLMISDAEKHFYSKPMREWVTKVYNKSSAKVFMITVNPIETTDIDEFMKKISKSVKKKFVETYMWCIEWRDEKVGMHCHIRITCNKKKKPSEIRREYYNTFKNLVGNRMHVNIRQSIYKTAFIQYINGIKDNNFKENYENDIDNRIEFGIKQIYESEL